MGENFVGQAVAVLLAPEEDACILRLEGIEELVGLIGYGDDLLYFLDWADAVDLRRQLLEETHDVLLNDFDPLFVPEFHIHGGQVPLGDGVGPSLMNPDAAGNVGVKPPEATVFQVVANEDEGLGGEEGLDHV